MLGFYIGFGLTFVAYCAYDTYKIIKKLDEFRDIKKEFEE
jgi:hypothetical protein